jgi:hypothetical protein
MPATECRVSLDAATAVRELPSDGELARADVVRMHRMRHVRPRATSCRSAPRAPARRPAQASLARPASRSLAPSGGCGVRARITKA